jgi:hypothetical protein
MLTLLAAQYKSVYGQVQNFSFYAELHSSFPDLFNFDYNLVLFNNVKEIELPDLFHVVCNILFKSINLHRMRSQLLRIDSQLEFPRCFLFLKVLLRNFKHQTNFKTYKTLK